MNICLLVLFYSRTFYQELPIYTNLCQELEKRVEYQPWPQRTFDSAEGYQPDKKDTCQCILLEEKYKVLLEHFDLWGKGQISKIRRIKESFKMEDGS